MIYGDFNLLNSSIHMSNRHQDNIIKKHMNDNKWICTITSNKFPPKKLVLWINVTYSHLDGGTARGTKWAYADSLSAATRCAFWNSFKTASKSLASFASPILLLACSKKFQGISFNTELTKTKRTRKRRTLKHHSTCMKDAISSVLHSGDCYIINLHKTFILQDGKTLINKRHDSTSC